MAPRTAKAKKADVKVAENEAPKKGRGKAKNVEETEQDLEQLPEVDIDEKIASTTEKKAKRGKKGQEANGDSQTNGNSEETAPLAKRGRKKNEPVPEEKSTNGDHSADEEVVTEQQNGDAESNDNAEEEPSSSKSRKKQTKKEEKPKETGRGRKAKQVEAEEKEVDEKPKAKGRGRKAKPEPEPVEEEDKTEPAEEAKAEPATKGRKKKAIKEKSPESDKMESNEEEKLEEPKEAKKETKGRKGAKKAQAKEEDGVTEGKEEPASKKRKVNKKEEKGKGDSKDEELAEEEVQETETKPKGKKGQKKAEAAAPEAEDQLQDSAELTSKRRRKPAEEKAPAKDSKQKAPAKNKAATDYDELDFSNNSKTPQGKEWNFKISSWNVDGIRAWANKGGLDYIKHEKPDILCLQETKCAQDKLPEELANVPGYHAYWLGSDKDGYAGVGIYTTKLAMNVQYGLQNEELDEDGRIITAEYEEFYLICTYVPNAGKKLVTLPKRLRWNEEFRKFVKELDQKKPVIICGDMNVAHEEIDLTNPKTNRKNAGFTEEERQGMTELLGDGFVDTFRHFYPDKTGAYTFWTYMMNARSKNVGWRLDYFIVSERLVPNVCDNVIRDQVYGSDHCPLALFLHLTSADKPKE